MCPRMMEAKSMSWFFCLFLAICANASEPAVTAKPEVIHVGMAAPDVIVLTIQAQSVAHGKQIPYDKQPGDKVVVWRQHRFLQRGETRIGTLVGKEGKILFTPDRLLGDPLDTKTADQAGTYRLTSENAKISTIPKAVHRKSKPVDFARSPAREASAMEHTLMLELSESLAPGKKYTLHFLKGWISQETISYICNPADLRSEAIHVNQVGYRPDDPVKLAFLSFWMGDGGGLKYPEGKAFSLLDEKTGRKDLKQQIHEAMLRDAERMSMNCESTDFHWAGGPTRPIRWGALSMPESHVLFRAHFITGKEKYLRAIVLSTLSGAGANPVNMCFVTSVGTRWPKHPLHEDAAVSNQPVYEGVTIGGPVDPVSPKKDPTAARFERLLYPPAAKWPATESYFDVFGYVSMNEFTVHQTMLPTSFVWGYLAARK